jgi:mono/diheme cytochrome c family protein
MTQEHDERRQQMAQVNREVQLRNRITQVLLLLVSLATIVLLVQAALRDNVTSEWRDHQAQYALILEQKATDDWGRSLADDFQVKMAQIVIPTLDRTDRCITCHTGIDDPRMTDQANPYAVHPGRFLEWHEADKFGCTVCHQGQGSATEQAAAHGQVSHWDYPLLSAESAYTQCAQCHYENDLFGAEEDIFTKQALLPPIRQQELSDTIPGLAAPRSLSVARGKQLVIRLGCLGCHSYRGRGGSLGPDISYVGDKSVHDYDFSHVHSTGKRSVAVWLLEHFQHPAAVSPGTLMPDYQLTVQQAMDLTNYMLNLHRKRMPSDYTPLPVRNTDAPAEGHQLYALFCSGCHGSEGQGSTIREDQAFRALDAPPELMVPSLSNPDTLAVISDEHLRYILQNGRAGSNMIGWAPGADGNLNQEEIERLLAHMRSWQTPAPDLRAIESTRGDANMGRILYQAQCASCHGRQGQGGIGTRLHSPGFLAVASDLFLARTLIHGRANTAMPSWRHLGPQRMSDVMAFLRAWHEKKSDQQASLKLLASARDKGEANVDASVSVRIGELLYQANCVTCHGLQGQGDLGPSLSTPEFLTLVDDAYLHETVVRGRPGTGMPAWRHFSTEDVASLVLYMDAWRQRERKEMATGPIQGDWDAGRIMYGHACAGCHGDEAQGSMGPQLRNAQFLRQTSDSMLREWIAHGKVGTPMLGFLRGNQGMVDLSVHQIDNVIAYLRSLERQAQTTVAKYASGRPGLGQVWYATYCVSCHGDFGEGASGPAISNQDFLQASSSGFLMATLAMGRDGTEMRPVKRGAQSILSLSSDQVNDLVAYMRQWELSPAQSTIAHRHVIPWDLEHGRQLYQSNCAGCHGVNGKAELDESGRQSAWAPELNNQDFLRAGTDGFLQATIVRGRSGTSMRAFGQGSQGLTDLSADDIDDIVAYIRQWSTQAELPMTIPAQRGQTGQGP